LSALVSVYVVVDRGSTHFKNIIPQNKNPATTSAAAAQPPKKNTPSPSGVKPENFIPSALRREVRVLFSACGLISLSIFPPCLVVKCGSDGKKFYKTLRARENFWQEFFSCRTNPHTGNPEKSKLACFCAGICAWI
jgi:hypothetical protein